MKKKLLNLSTLLLAFSLSSTAFAQTWSPIFSPGDSTDVGGTISNTSLDDFSFFDENNGIVSLGYGYHTTSNGGTTWSKEAFFSGNLMSGVHFSTAQNIFMAVGGDVYKSANKGTSFSLEHTHSPSVFNGDIKVVGSFGLIAATSCKAAYSVNGGDTWTSISNTLLCGNLSDLNTVEIVNATTAFIGGRNGNLFKTTDGGINWSRVTVPVSSANITGIDFLDSQIGFLVQVASSSSTGSVHKTSDGGATWTSIPTPVPSGFTEEYLSGIYAVDANTIYVGGKGRILKSIDGGANYTVDFTNPACSSCNTLQIEKAGTILVASIDNGGAHSKLYKKTIGNGTTAILENKTDVTISVLPNPANDFVMIEGLDFENTTVANIFSIDGKLVKTIQQPQSKIDIADLNASLYFVKIETKDGRSGIAKFIKQ